MDFDPVQRREALQKFMEREKLKPTPLEQAAEVGEGTLRKFLDGTSETLTDRTYTKLSLGAGKLLGRFVDSQELRTLPSDDISVTSSLSTDLRAMLEGGRQRIVPASPPPPLPNRHGPKAPLMGTALAGSEGDFLLNSGEPVDHVPMPDHIAQRKGVFCVLVEGDSMRPWKKPGQILYLDPTRRPQINDYVVVELKGTPPYEDRPAFLKLLVGRSATKLKLQQYRPDKVFEIDLRRVHRIFRVIPDDELLGHH